MGVSFLIYLLIMHFVADFLFQSREMGQKKSSSLKWLCKHGLIHFAVFAFGTSIYCITFFYPLLPVDNIFLVGIIVRNIIISSCIFAAINMAAHMTVDACTWNVYKWTVALRNKDKTKEGLRKDFKYWEDSWFYHTIGIDQLFHIITIILVYGGLIFQWHIG